MEGLKTLSGTPCQNIKDILLQKVDQLKQFIETHITCGEVTTTTAEPLLLNLYPGASVAYSLRELNSDYAGYCIKVRRSSDDALLDIGFVNGLLDEDSLTSFVGAGSGYVHTWYDQSGNGNNLTQTTNSKQPRIVNSGTVDKKNSKPCFVYDGSDDVLTTTLDLNTEFNLIIHSKHKSDGTIYSYKDVSISGTTLSVGGIQINSFAYFTDGKQLPLVMSDSSVVNSDYLSSIIPNDYTVLNVRWSLSDNTIKARCNGIDLSDNTTSNTLRTIGTGTPDTFFQSEVFEIVYYEDRFSDRVGIEDNIQTFYGLTDATKPSEECILSLRLLNSSYTGYCIKVRRSSDDTTQDIGFSSGALDQTALTTFVGAGSGYVHTWYDQSGNGNNFTQTTNANQPRIVSSGTVETENSLPIINFGTNSDAYCLVSASGFMNGYARLSYIQVAKITDFASSNAGVFAPSTTHSTGLEILQHTVISRRAYMRINNTTKNDNSGDAYQLWNNAVVCLTELYNSEYGFKAFKDSGAVTLTSYSAVAALNFNGVYAIGRYASSYYSYMKIFELRINDLDMKSFRSTIESDINDYYSIY